MPKNRFLSSLNVYNLGLCPHGQSENTHAHYFLCMGNQYMCMRVSSAHAQSEKDEWAIGFAHTTIQKKAHAHKILLMASQK